LGMDSRTHIITEGGWTIREGGFSSHARAHKWHRKRMGGWKRRGGAGAEKQETWLRSVDVGTGWVERDVAKHLVSKVAVK
jgi:hypothetical protein